MNALSGSFWAVLPAFEPSFFEPRRRRVPQLAMLVPSMAMDRDESASSCTVALTSIAQAAALQEWTEQMQELRFLLSVASGQSASGVTSLILKKGEIGIAQISNVGLIEDRKGAGQWKGASQGVSFPIGRIAGRPIRYRVSGSRGHYVQGAPVPTAVDMGTLTITNQRIVYQG